MFLEEHGSESPVFTLIESNETPVKAIRRNELRKGDNNSYNMHNCITIGHAPYTIIEPSVIHSEEL